VAPGVVDARRCLAGLVQAPGDFPREHRVALDDRLYGCDDCQEVCPPNRRADRAGPGDTSGPAWVDVLELLAASDEQLLARHGHWYIPRRQPRFLRRNALVVLGNRGAPLHPATVAALNRYLGDPDPMLRAHAAWAARRLGRLDLLAARVADPAVAGELEQPSPPARTPPR
jgi:epoxyqueuosine reductase